MPFKRIVWVLIFVANVFLTFAQDEIIFLSNRIQGSYAKQLYKMKSDGTDQKIFVGSIIGCSLFGIGHFGVCTSIAVTLRGDKVAFIDAEDKLYTVDRDGNNLNLISESGMQPAWSPDGKKLLYVEGGEYKGNLFLYDVAKGKSVKITDDDKSFTPSWFPDNSTFAFSFGARSSFTVCIMNINGGAKKQISPKDQSYCNPIVSPKGDKIAFNSEVWVNSRIFITDTNGNHLIQFPYDVSAIVEDDSEFGIWGTYCPAWSPDGSKIAYVSWNNRSSGICTINADGTDQKTLIDVVEQNTDPSWSFDGKYILFSGFKQIFKMKADGTEKTDLSKYYSGCNGPAFWIKH